MPRSITLTLDQLAVAGLVIQPGAAYEGEWFCNDYGPYETPEAAALAQITRIITDAARLERLANEDAGAFRKAQREHDA